MGPEVGFVIETHYGKKVLLRTSTSAFDRILLSNTDLTQVSQTQLTALAHNLNTIPRKCLGFKTPAGVFASLLQEAA
ncbi:hypothetical protein [Brucella pseudogrignonensis]|uniref:Transposase n=1 Tax=Brucella pseudogrignonensis TaxID=419475 RepID=A0ABU1M994_9HYPH|nr:hypothetical protein [Brucella pseudogrignonensis]